MRSIYCDAWIEDSRDTKHDTFNQQIDMANIIIGHKADLYDDLTLLGLMFLVTT
ncbi:MAG: G3E family GTPase [Lentisphaeria bacterium]|jgi:G3E family GTPase